MQEYVKNINDLKDEDFIDGWALVNVEYDFSKCNNGAVQFYSRQPDLRFFLPNNAKTQFQTNLISLIVPESFLTSKTETIKNGIKPTLLALLDVDLKYFREIPLDVASDRKFYSKFVRKAIQIAKQNRSTKAIKELTHMTQEVDIRKRSLTKISQNAAKTK